MSKKKAQVEVDAQGPEDAPNVFISWSGNRSLHVATAIHEALKKMMDAARPWRSDEGIRTGEAWFPAIMAALRDSKIGIVCLTPESLPKPWLNFEAGAIAGKVRNRSLVMTVRAAGVTTKDVEPPLSMYQGGDVTDEKFMLKLFQDVAKAIGANVAPASLQDRFNEYVWPKFKERIKEMPKPEEDVPPHRKPDEVMGEILDVVRGIRADLAPSTFVQGGFVGGYFPVVSQRSLAAADLDSSRHVAEYRMLQPTGGGGLIEKQEADYELAKALQRRAKGKAGKTPRETDE